LAGNSLGLQPRTARLCVEKELQKWEKLAVEGHFSDEDPWFTYQNSLIPLAAKLVGAKNQEVTIMNSLTVNLHLMLASFYKPSRSRYKIIVESDIFISDRIAIESYLRVHGHNPEEVIVQIKPRDGEKVLTPHDIIQALVHHNESVSLVFLGCPNYLTGQVFDIEEITKTGHSYGQIVGFDLAHAVGNIPLNLNKWGVDFAIWCSYKYLNSGPGGPAGCFIHERHFDEGKGIARYSGWWGQPEEKRFSSTGHFEPSVGAAGWQISNPPILQLATLKAALEIFESSTIEVIRKKSILITGYLEYLLDTLPKGWVNLVTPREVERRGAQLSVEVRWSAEKIIKLLSAKKMICDYRAPNIIRITPAPLYNSFMDVYLFFNEFRSILEELNRLSLPEMKI
jgi:kynureninase